MYLISRKYTKIPTLHYLKNIPYFCTLNPQLF